MRASIRKPGLVCLAVAACGLGLSGAARAQGNGDKWEANVPNYLRPIEQVAPLSGAVLRGGSTAELRWRELTDFGRLGEIDEWEAFLSLDGGKTYPIRITPHLDRDVQVLRWQVPAVATADARLLFRFGNEEDDEVGFAPPVRFRIELPAVAENAFPITERAPQRGESARPGQPGVVSWVAGSRRGTDLRWVEASRPLELHPHPAIDGGSSAEPLLFAPDERKDEVRADHAASTALPARAAHREPAFTAPPAAPPIPPLLQTQRQNE